MSLGNFLPKRRNMLPIYSSEELDLLTINIEKTTTNSKDETNQTFKFVGFVSKEDVIEIFIL
jgi:hypothetical protein